MVTAASPASMPIRGGLGGGAGICDRPHAASSASPAAPTLRTNRRRLVQPERRSIVGPFHSALLCPPADGRSSRVLRSPPLIAHRRCLPTPRRRPYSLHARAWPRSGGEPMSQEINELVLDLR